MKKNNQKTKDWEIKKLGDICDILDNQRKPITKKDRVAGQYPYYGATGILDYVEGFIFDERLILIGEDGAKWKSGDHTAFPVEGKIWVNNHAHVIRPHRDKTIIDSWILYYFYVTDLSEHITGVTVPKLNQGKLKEIEVSFPKSLDEQKRIVEILDEAFDNIEKARGNAEKNLENVKELFKSYLQGVFEKGDGWEEKNLEELGKITSSKRIYKKEYVKEGIPFYRIKEIKELAHDKNITIELYISRLRYKEIKDSFGIPQIGDILMTAVGTIGEIYVIKNNKEFYFKDGNILWFKDFDSINSYFLKYVLISFIDQLNKISQGSAYSALTIEKINKHKILIPSLDKQKQIVKKLDDLKEKVDGGEEIFLRKIAVLDELKKSLLQKAFNGEL